MDSDLKKKDMLSCFTSFIKYEGISTLNASNILRLCCPMLMERRFSGSTRKMGWTISSIVTEAFVFTQSAQVHGHGSLLHASEREREGEEYGRKDSSWESTIMFHIR